MHHISKQSLSLSLPAPLGRDLREPPLPRSPSSLRPAKVSVTAAESWGEGSPQLGVELAIWPFKYIFRSIVE